MDRTARVWASIARCAAERDSPVRVSHACLAAVPAVGVDGAALVVVTGRGVREAMFATDELAERIAELQSTLGEGPAIDAFRDGGPVLVADLGSAEIGRRWPAFTQQAHQAGVGAVFSLPIRAGAARLGVLDLYRQADSQPAWSRWPPPAGLDHLATATTPLTTAVEDAGVRAGRRRYRLVDCANWGVSPKRSPSLNWTSILEMEPE